MIRKLLGLFLSVVLIPSCFLSAQESDRIFSDYLTPQMFGAKGDGKKDDTDALRKALYESSTQGKILYFPSGKTYKVTGTLNYYKGAYQNLKLNIRYLTNTNTSNPFALRFPSLPKTFSDPGAPFCNPEINIRSFTGVKSQPAYSLSASPPPGNSFGSWYPILKWQDKIVREGV